MRHESHASRTAPVWLSGWSGSILSGWVRWGLSAVWIACLAGCPYPDPSTPTGGGAPTLTQGLFRVVGRGGRDLRIDVTGTDAEGDVTGVWVRLRDAADNPVVGLDLRVDGRADASEGVLALPERPAAGEFSAFVTLGGGMILAPAVARMDVAVVDAAGHRSGSVRVGLTAQTIQPNGASCDPGFVANRCEPGLGCRGVPPTCQPGDTPQIVRAVYTSTVAGPVIRVEGTDADDDIDVLVEEFLDADGLPVRLDLDGDDAPDSDTFEITGPTSVGDGMFFFEVTPTESFVQEVPRVALTPRDRSGRSGARVVVDYGAVPARVAGESCDPRGFDACAEGSACVPGRVGVSNLCRAVADERQSRCNEAPRLDPFGGITEVTGRAEGASLWDAPAGCVSNSPVDRPEGTALLHLSRAASRVILTTDRDGTNFDTILHVHAGCPDAGDEALACADDAPTCNGPSAESASCTAGVEGVGIPQSSTLVLDTVPAGDYLLVIDSFGVEGGSFRIAAEAQ